MQDKKIKEATLFPSGCSGSHQGMETKEVVSGNRSTATSELTGQPHLCVLVSLDKQARQKAPQSLKWVRLKANQMVSSELIAVDVFTLTPHTHRHTALES